MKRPSGGGGEVNTPITWRTDQAAGTVCTVIEAEVLRSPISGTEKFDPHLDRGLAALGKGSHG